MSRLGPLGGNTLTIMGQSLPPASYKVLKPSFPLGTKIKSKNEADTFLHIDNRRASDNFLWDKVAPYPSASHDDGGYEIRYLVSTPSIRDNLDIFRVYQNPVYFRYFYLEITIDRTTITCSGHMAMEKTTSRFCTFDATINIVTRSASTRSIRISV